MIVTIAVFVVLFVLFMFALHMFISRGRIKFSVYLYEVIFALLSAIPVFIVSFYRLVEEKPLLFFLYLGICYIILSPVFFLIWSNVIKKREPITRALLLSLEMLFISVSPYFKPPLAFVFIGVGVAFCISFFMYIRCNPYLNETWVLDVVEKTAALIDKKGKYSPKPVVVKLPCEKRFVAGTIGLTLMFKEGRSIGRISRTLHRKLGEPNLVVFFEELSGKVLQCQNGEKTE